MSGFKNALCGVTIPEDIYRMGDYWVSCKRGKRHKGLHRVKFRDGKYRTWAAGVEVTAVKEESK